MNAPIYPHRREAGRKLAAALLPLLPHPDRVVVLALPRGGVPVALEVARALGAPLDVFVVRKLGVPGQPEVAFGAIAAGGFELLDHALIRRLGLSSFEIATIADHETAILQRCEEQYRAHLAPVPLRDRDVVIVDDGLATGWSMQVAVEAVRACEPHRLIAAVPVGASDSCARIAAMVDALVCPCQPEPFEAVGRWYQDFGATSETEIRGCLATAAMERTRAAALQAAHV